MAQQQKTIPTLINLAHSQAHRCLWALEEIALTDPNFTFQVKNYPRTMANTDMLPYHRLGKSPIMLLESTDGSPPPTVQLEPGVLTESKLILEFINEEYGAQRWTPASQEDRRRDRFFNNFATGTMITKADFMLLFDHPGQMAPFPISAFFWLAGLPFRMRFQQDLNAVFALMEDALSDEKPWFGGAQIGVSDFNMTFGMDICEHRGYFDKSKFPKLAGWIERIRKREAWQRAVAKGNGYDLNLFGRRTGWAGVLFPAKE